MWNRGEGCLWCWHGELCACRHGELCACHPSCAGASTAGDGDFWRIFLKIFLDSGVSDYVLSARAGLGQGCLCWRDSEESLGQCGEQSPGECLPTHKVSSSALAPSSNLTALLTDLLGAGGLCLLILMKFSTCSPALRLKLPGGKVGRGRFLQQVLLWALFGFGRGRKRYSSW